MVFSGCRPPTNKGLVATGITSLVWFGVLRPGRHSPSVLQKMKFDQLSVIFDKAWAHFDSLAKQRLTAHNFYFIIVAASIATLGKIVTDLRPEDDWGRLWHLFAGFNFIIPIVFLCLDARFKHLMESLKETLIWVETQKEWPPSYRTFSQDKKKGLRRHVSLTNGMRIAFVIHALIAIWLYIDPISPRVDPPAMMQFPPSTPPPQQSQELPKNHAQAAPPAQKP